MSPYMMKKGFLYDLKDAFDWLLGFNVIFFGEEHGSSLSHKAERTLLKGLSKRDPKVVLALEMFERDVQDILNAYLKGKISERTFLKRSRPWPNYRKDYRPLVEFAKKKKIPVLAANVPRRAAAAVSMANQISPEVMGEDRIYLPQTIHLKSKLYYNRFMASLVGMPHSSPMKTMNREGLYKAQVLKDAVMAASLEPYLNRRILFCCGHFHSDYHLGIVYQLKKNHPELKTAVIVTYPTVEPLAMKERSRVADFIWIEE